MQVADLVFSYCPRERGVTRRNQTYRAQDNVPPSHSITSDHLVGLRPTPRSADRARSLARVSQKREYFKCRPETIEDFAPKLFKLGV
jgi:hypothetical protein